MKEIEFMEQWHTFAGTLHKQGYRLWRWQYHTRHPEGFHAWFWATGRPDIEIVTHNDDVCWGVLNFNRE